MPRNKFRPPNPFFPLSAAGAMQAEFDAMGGTDFFGDLVTKEEDLWTFANGACVCYNPQLHAAFEVHGAIYAKMAQPRGERLWPPVH
jgi:hypothetical protein